MFHFHDFSEMVLKARIFHRALRGWYWYLDNRRLINSTHNPQEAMDLQQTSTVLTAVFDLNAKRIILILCQGKACVVFSHVWGLLGGWVQLAIGLWTLDQIYLFFICGNSGFKKRKKIVLLLCNLWQHIAGTLHRLHLCLLHCIIALFFFFFIYCTVVL